MPSLTETAIVARKVIKYTLIGLVAIIIMVPLGRAFKNYWAKTHPAPPPPPTMDFGALPPINFGPSQSEKFTKLSYRLETPDNTLPNLGTQAPVYFIATLGPKFFDEEKTREKARAINFLYPPQKTKPTEFSFLNPETKAVLKIDTINNNFEFRYPYQADPTITRLPAPSKQRALSASLSFLKKMKQDTSDLDAENPQYVFLRYRPEERDLVTAPSLSEGQFTKVILYRKNIDGLPILPPNNNGPNIFLIVSGATESEKKIVFARYIHFPIDYQRRATYPIKSTATAWEELKAGKGYIENFGNNNPQEPIVIRKIYLAFFDPDTPQNFLQPIFVFEGDNNFRAYIPAVSASSIKG